jgi:ribosomal protein S18 acetylase RimI-like enzyme
MVPPEGLAIRRVLPEEAPLFSEPLAHFIDKVHREHYLGTLGVDMAIPRLDAYRFTELESRLALSTDLGPINEDRGSYVMALASPPDARPDIVGLAKFSRHEQHLVELEELDVASQYRGQRVATRMIDFALRNLKFRVGDIVTLQVLAQNLDAQAYYQCLGFTFSRRTEHHHVFFPDPNNYHKEMQAPLSALRIGVATHLARPSRR